MQQTCLLDVTCVCQPNEHISSNISKYGGQKPNTLSKNVQFPALSNVPTAIMQNVMQVVR
jgi:hypothetical protein